MVVLFKVKIVQCEILMEEPSHIVGRPNNGLKTCQFFILVMKIAESELLVVCTIVVLCRIFILFK